MDKYNFSGKKILIAEDESTNFLYLKALLKKTNAEIVWAKNGAEAVEAVASQPDIDIVLMDMMMPVMDGKTAAVEIKKFCPQMVIIAQTAFALFGEREEILAAGCDNYVSKPIAGNLLLEMINGYLTKIQ
ncbi:MAG: response regulator [Salinivirgaceae bacterium]|nr:response regulator [Salinivirgaceae bacterium]